MRVDTLGEQDVQSLANLHGDEGEEVEGSVVDGLVRDGNGQGDALRDGLDVGEFQSLLLNLGDLVCNAGHHVVGTDRPQVVTDHTRQDVHTGGERGALNLRVHHVVNGDGDGTAADDVGGGVLVGTRGDGVQQYGGSVGTLLLHVLQVLTQTLVLVLAFADACHGGFVGIHLDAALVGFKLALQLLLLDFLLGGQFTLLLLGLVVHSGKAVLNLAVARHQLHDFLFVHCLNV